MLAILWASPPALPVDELGFYYVKKFNNYLPNYSELMLNHCHPANQETDKNYTY